jgi:uncharacterized protein YkwD
MFRPSMLAMLTFVILVQPSARAGDRKEAFKLSDDEQAVLDLTNAERKKAGLPAFKPSTQLFEAARSHAANMARQGSLDHFLGGTTPAGRILGTGYRFSACGENIAWNQASPKDAITSWMNSYGHRGNVLNGGYTEIGVAVAKNAGGERYWIQVFATPLPR